MGDVDSQEFVEISTIDGVRIHVLRGPVRDDVVQLQLPAKTHYVYIVAMCAVLFQCRLDSQQRQQCLHRRVTSLNMIGKTRGRVLKLVAELSS
jgi:hypothetical protein